MALNISLRNLATMARHLNRRCIHTSRIVEATFTETGVVLPNPGKTKSLHFLCAMTAVSAGIYTGGMMSKSIAEYLEENEYFVPSDDDDDD